MACIAPEDIGPELLAQVFRQGELQSSVPGLGVIDIKAIAVSIDEISFFHSIETGVIGPVCATTANTQLQAVEPNNIDISNFLATLQAIQFTGLRGSKASRKVDVELMAGSEKVSKPKLWREIAENVLAVCRTVETTSAARASSAFVVTSPLIQVLEVP